MVSAWAKLTSGGGTSNTKKNNLVLSISGQTVSESYSALWTCDWLFFLHLKLLKNKQTWGMLTKKSIMQVSTICYQMYFSSLNIWNPKHCKCKWFGFTKTVISYGSPNLLVGGFGCSGYSKISLSNWSVQLPWRIVYYFAFLSRILLLSGLQEDLTPKDIEDIIDELKAGRVPPPGPRFIFSLNDFSLFLSYATHFRVLSI